MSLNISHDDALRVSLRAGALVASLYGRPDLVIGIEHGGTAVAAAFAKGAEVCKCTLIQQHRWTTTGWRGKARRFIQRVTPIKLRKLFRRWFFSFIVSTSKRIQPQVFRTDRAASEKLMAAVGAHQHEFIVVVDDAIDSGGTALRVLADLGELAPRARIVLFTLTSTVGERVTDEQINAFAEILEYEQGDIGKLAPAHRDAAEFFRPTNVRATDRPENRTCRTLYLDLDGTLVIDSFRSARNTLLRYLVRAGSLRSAARLFVASTAKKLRLINHQQLKILVDGLIRGLSPDQNEVFQSMLAVALNRDSRWTLTTLAKAPKVRSRIVTAALASYSRAIEIALGIPVLIGSGPGPDGEWVEVDARIKVDAVRSDRQTVDCKEAPSLFIGDSIVDSLAYLDGVPVAILPKWDRTGLLTILAANYWWRA